MNAHAKVAKNSATANGGGILAVGDLIMNAHSSVKDNTSGGGGGIFFNGSVITMNERASISDNKAPGSSDDAGGSPSMREAPS